jgi:hypothetical protein
VPLGGGGYENRQRKLGKCELKRQSEVRNKPVKDDFLSISPGWTSTVLSKVEHKSTVLIMSNHTEFLLPYLTISSHHIFTQES